MEKYFTRLNNTFHAVIAGPLILFIYVYLQIDTGRITPLLPGNNTIIIAGGLTFLYLAFLFGVFKNYRKSLKDLSRRSGSLEERLDQYSKESTRFYLFVTAPSLLIMLAMILTAQIGFSLAYFLQLFVLSVFRPSVHNIVKGLGLKDEERQIVLKKKEFSGSEQS